MTQLPKVQGFAEACEKANAAFNAECKRQHDHLISLGYVLVSQLHDEWVYQKTRPSGGPSSITMPVKPSPIIPLNSELLSALKKIFPDATLSLDISLRTESASCRISGDFVFHFVDMPKLAEAFGTERLNFRQEAGTEGYHYSSWTYDSGTEPSLYIEANYAPTEPKEEW